MRFLLFLSGLLIYGCSNNAGSEGQSRNDSLKTTMNPEKSAIARLNYSSFSVFRDSVSCNSLNFSPIKIKDSLVINSGKDTIIHYFDFAGIKFKYISVLNEKQGDDPCDRSTSYYFIVNEEIVKPKSIPDSLRNHGFELREYCGLTLELA